MINHHASYEPSFPINHPHFDVQDLLELWRELWAKSRSSTWAAARFASEAVQQHGLTNKKLGDEVGVTGQRIGQYIKAVHAIDDVLAETGVDYSERITVESAQKAAEAYNGFRGEEKKAQSLAEIMALAADGTSSRQIRSKASGEARRRRMTEAQAIVEASAKTEWRTRCIEGDCQDFLATVEAGSIKILHADVPYSDHRRDPKQENKRARKLGLDEESKGYTSGREATSAVLTSCANNDHDDALELTLHILRTCEPKLAKFGIVLLWQAGTRPLRTEIQNVIDAKNLEVAFELVLDKCRDEESSEAGNPGNFAEPYSIGT